MTTEAISAAIARVRSIEADLVTLRRALDAERLVMSDRQYLARCFDLLDMELTALRLFLDGLA